MTIAKENATKLRNDIIEIKRERILTEAVNLFYEHGYLPTSVDAIAQQLGATKPFVYYHFKNKVDLLSEVCMRVMEEALMISEAATKSEGSPMDRLTEFVLRFTDLALTRHKYVSIYFREELNLPAPVNEKIREFRKRIDYLIRSILKDGQRTSDFEPVNLLIASQIITGMISYTFAWYNEKNSVSHGDIKRHMLEGVLRLIVVDQSEVQNVIKGCAFD